MLCIPSPLVPSIDLTAYITAIGPVCRRERRLVRSLPNNALATAQSTNVSHSRNGLWREDGMDGNVVGGVGREAHHICSRVAENVGDPRHAGARRFRYVDARRV